MSTCPRPPSTESTTVPMLQSKLIALSEAASHVEALPEEKITRSRKISGNSSSKTGRHTCACGKSQAAPIPTRKEIFPVRLMQVVSNPAYANVIAFLQEGTHFVILDPDKFAKEVIPVEFGVTKLPSFTRRLSRWGFTQVHRLRRPGYEKKMAFYHPMFVKGNMEMCSRICTTHIEALCAKHHAENQCRAFVPNGINGRGLCVVHSAGKNAPNRCVTNCEINRTREAVETAPLQREIIHQAKYAELLKIHSSLQRRVVAEQRSGLQGNALLPQSAVDLATKTVLLSALACARRDRELRAVVSAKRKKGEEKVQKDNRQINTAAVALPPRKRSRNDIVKNNSVSVSRDRSCSSHANANIKRMHQIHHLTSALTTRAGAA